MVAIMYESGFGVNKDLEKAIKWHINAAMLGSIDSSFFLANNYLEGKTVKKDINKSIFWHEKLAKKEYVPSIFTLGQIYLNSNLIKKDSKKAFSYFLQAARLDHREAQKQIAYMYKEGIGTKKSNWKSKYWSKKFLMSSEKEK